MTKFLATASVLALMAAAPAWAANPASAPNGSVPYQPTTTAANGNQATTAPTAQNNQAAANTDTNAENEQAAGATAPTANGAQPAQPNHANAASEANANQSANTPPNSQNQQTGNQPAGATKANEAATPPENAQNEQAAKPAETNNAAANQAGQSAGAESTAAAGAATQAINDTDRNFVKQATSASMAEIAEGKLAMQRASDLAVRQFGRWMVTDHTQMVDILSGPAKTAGITVTAKLTPEDQDNFNKLQSLNGVEFEKQYVIGQVAAHQKALQLFRQEAQSGQNAGLQAIAKLGEPMLKQHLAAAQDLQSAMPEIVAATQNATKK